MGWDIPNHYSINRVCTGLENEEFAQLSFKISFFNKFIERFEPAVAFIQEIDIIFSICKQVEVVTVILQCWKNLKESFDINMDLSE